MINKSLCFISIIAGITTLLSAADLSIEIDALNSGPELPETLYGIFFEDINFAADGGLYAELLQNRSFEYYPIKGWEQRSEEMNPLYAWEKIQSDDSEVELSVESEQPLNRNNTKYVRMNIRKSGKESGIRNLGYEGIPINGGEEYRFSLYIRCEGDFNSPMTVSLLGKDDVILASGKISNISSTWKKHEVILKAGRSDPKATLVLTASREGALCLDMVSLFPVKTFKGRKNGLRADLAQTIADLKPKTFRFPGGCIVHGVGLDNAYRWKDTVGDVAERKPNWNRWGYHQSYGLGYFEYLLFAEDIGSTPLPIMPLGISCSFSKPFENAPMDKLQEWIDDIIDLIEFANGPADSKWGGLRASMGHPEPFNLKCIGLGNEEGHTKEFEERFPHFVEQLRQKHPEIKLIGTSGLSENIPIYEFMNQQKVDLTDEHYYMDPEWFIENDDRFDSFDRSKVKVYVGEYASKGNTMFNAVAEAVFLTGIERNADMVHMTAYAPLLARYGFTQWKAADLIWFDHEQVIPTPNYYVQQMFSLNKGDYYVPCTKKLNIETEPAPAKTGKAGLATWNTTVEYDDFKVIGGNGAILQDGFESDSGKWMVQNGNFVVAEGVLRQGDIGARPALSFFKTPARHENMTISVRARKTGGDEGFMIVFGGIDDNHYYWWNVGGWGNKHHGIEYMDGNTKKRLANADGMIESDRWYDLLIKIEGDHIQCFIDGKKVHDITDKPQGFNVGVSVAKDKSAGELIIKIANPLEKPLETEINLKDIAKLASNEARVITLTGAKNDINDLENPDKVKPVESSLKVAPEFTCKIPAMSVQFIRLKVD